MAIDDHGKVYAWGLNQRDIFTRGGEKIAPVEVLGLKGKEIGNITLWNGKYFVIYANKVCSVYPKLSSITSFYDVQVIWS
jgi:hypothetical protein